MSSRLTFSWLLLYVGWSVCLSVCRLECHNFLTRQESYPFMLLSEHLLNYTPLLSLFLASRDYFHEFKLDKLFTFSISLLAKFHEMFNNSWQNLLKSYSIHMNYHFCRRATIFTTFYAHTHPLTQNPSVLSFPPLWPHPSIGIPNPAALFPLYSHYNSHKNI